MAARRKKIRVVEATLYPLFTRFGETREIYLTTLTPGQLKRKLEKECKEEYEVYCEEIMSLTESQLKQAVSKLLSGKENTILIGSVMKEE